MGGLSAGPLSGYEDADDLARQEPQRARADQRGDEIGMTGKTLDHRLQILI